ncbi:MAG: TolC family protein, partial [Deltaproteobacteria bacterium]
MSPLRAIAPKLIVGAVFFMALSSAAGAGEGRQEAAPSAPRAPETLSLTLEEATVFALENSLDVQIARFDAHAKQNDLPAALSLFDTYFTAQASYDDNQLKKSTSILGSRALNTDYALGLSKLLPTGTTVGLSLDHSRAYTNSAFASINPAHQALATLTLSQQLGRNFFGLIDRANIRITKLDIENSDWSSLDKIEAALASVQKAYWQLAYLNEELAIKRDMLDKAKDLFAAYEKQRALGLVEDPEYYGAEANVVDRENDLLGTADAIYAARNQLLLLLNQDARLVQITPADRMALVDDDVDLSAALKRAVGSRRDYKSALNDVEKKKLEVVVKKSSLWPEIDLKASFARNGLSRAYDKAWDGIAG